jgi:DNA-binding CsgD family transcriptional regulator
MYYFLSDFFYQWFNRHVEFFTDYTPENIAHADVIILSLCNGERYTCFPELRLRQKGIIIGLVDEKASSERSPFCFADIVYIMRRESLNEITRKLTVAWRAWLAGEGFSQYITCFGCKLIKITPQQRKILASLHVKHSVKDVAENMCVNYKTISAHKYIVMRKFRLKNDYDLFHFLDMLHNKNITRIFL